uniref:Uncharacterized mitochondrial protein AtMg00810-like n=1 Tax=Nicotiana tabacum TaxID=4097 RepID=A0A1S4A0K7_TOBAC|nr:PREDICTED: uncharacterized mitochondrial protein AtMg00810-like [Nicotiana tabacum]
MARKIVVVLVYVDDLFITGIEFSKSGEGILMHQRKYALELIVDLGFSSSKPIVTPMELNVKLTTVEFDTHVGPIKDKALDDPGPYQRLLGHLLYLTITRPDISFVVHYLSQLMHSPKTSHWEVARQICYVLSWSRGLIVSCLF